MLPRTPGPAIFALLMCEACGPGRPGLELSTDAGQDVSETETASEGVRLLSKLPVPWESDASQGTVLRDTGSRAGPSDALTDARAPIAEKPVFPNDGSVDAPGDAVANDAALFGYLSCSAVLECARTGTLDTECLRGSSPEARVLAEPVLVCENLHCARACASSVKLSDCNACLLTACASALTACVRASGCGDRAQSPGEECDDGNDHDGDECTNACTSARCGDGIVAAAHEECDDGNAIETDACTSTCLRAVCGDGHVRAGIEGCDDGNRVAGDGCSERCLNESCGDGVVQPGEECDEGLANADGAPCLGTCRVNRCGDGKVCRDADAGCGTKLGTQLELCDNARSSDACRQDCTVAFCGDGDLRASVEECDDGNRNAFDGCSNECKAAASHLLITEVVTRPGGAEMIEIMNPTGFAIALSDYSLSDSHLYYKVASGTFTTASGSDFAARFPGEASIGPGEYRVVALGNASGGSASFVAMYGIKPDFELRPTANGASDDVGVPNMQSAQTAPSIGANASLTDGGEPVILFFYRGGALVSDVDYLFYGAPSTSNPVVDKTEVTIGDATYKADTAAALQHPIGAPGESGSIHRCGYSESSEVRGGGNGLMGHDETSEDPRLTFAVGKTTSERTPGEGPPSSVCKPW